MGRSFAVTGLKSAAFFGLLIATSLVSAGNYYFGQSRDCWPLCNGCWAVGAGAVYEEPCTQNFSVASGQVISGGSTFNTLLDVRPKFRWGFKVFADWVSCDRSIFVNATYRSIHAKYRIRPDISGFSLISVNHLGPFVVLPGSFLIGEQRTFYDTGYLRVGRSIAKSCCSNTYFYMGGRYVGIEIQRNITVSAGVAGFLANSTFTERSRFDGGAPEVGIGSVWELFCGLKLVGNFGLMGVIGQRKDGARVNPFLSEPAINFQQVFTKRTFTNSFLGGNARLGLAWARDLCFCNCNFCLVGEVGYEMDYYIHVLGLRASNFLTLTGGVDGSLDDAITNNFGSNGLYLSLTVGF